MSYIVLVFLLSAMLLGPALTADSVPPQPQQAPRNPAFDHWLSAPEPQGFYYDAPVSGYIPSPIDWSHLKDEPVGPAMYDMRSLPPAYDLRDFGLVSSVKDQLTCSTCWAFATMGSLESCLLKKYGQLWDFSENNLKNCHGFDRHPCNQGGNTNMSLAYMIRADGPVNEADDPYSTTDHSCTDPNLPIQKYVTTWIQLSSATDVKNAVLDHGAVASNMYWSPSYFNWSTNTYYCPSPSGNNHGITVIGWDDGLSVPGAPVTGAWLIKNSWGTGWGDLGYFWISYANTDMIADPSIADPVLFSDAVAPATYGAIYQHDTFGRTASFGYSQNYAWGANRFVPDEDEQIKAVGFYTMTDNTSYEIRMYSDMQTGVDFWGDTYYTFSGSLMSAVSGSFTHAGYYTVTLPQPVSVQNGNDFIVTVKWTTPGYDFPVPMEQRISGYASGVTSNPKESFASYSGNRYYDLKHYYSSTPSNVCIKALGTSSCGGGADIVPDCFIDGDDFEQMIRDWLMTAAPGALPGDIAPSGGDGTVNHLDFEVLAGQWYMSVNP